MSTTDHSAAGPQRPASGATRPGPLEGVLVADFSRVLAGPYATMLLADLGAEVVKVERPGAGDESRAWGPPFVDGESTYYLSANRNKRGIALDLRSPEGIRAARELARRADVVVENFRPGTMERLGLGYEELRAENPRLVYCAISGFGRAAGAHLTGYDFLVQAVGGLMSITGPAQGEPSKVGVALVDVVTGLFATIGILAALRERDAAGVGQRVDLDLLSCLLSVLVNQASGYLNTGQVPARMGNEHPSVGPYQLVAAADAQLVLAVGNDRQFAALAACLGRPALATDERYATNGGRIANRRALTDEIEAALAHDPAAIWIERFQEAGVPAGQVNDLAQAFDFAQRLGLDPSFELDRPGGAPVRQVANPLGFSGSPVRHRRVPPRLGEHTDEVLAWLGLSATGDARADGAAE